jgi:hypothetical protein
MKHAMASLSLSPKIRLTGGQGTSEDVTICRKASDVLYQVVPSGDGGRDELRLVDALIHASTLCPGRSNSKAYTTAP